MAKPAGNRQPGERRRCPGHVRIPYLNPVRPGADDTFQPDRHYRRRHAGYYGGRLDLWGQRFIEVWSGMPTLFLIILLSSVIQPDFWWLLGITVLFGWMSLVGVVRAEFLRTRNFDYIRAAQAMGVSDRMIMYRCMLPNAMVATLTYLPFILCGSITTLTSLDFLGFGLPMGSPSLGTLLLEGKTTCRRHGWALPYLWRCPWCCLYLFLSAKRCATPSTPVRRIDMSTSPLLQIKDLSIAFRNGERTARRRWGLA